MDILIRPKGSIHSLKRRGRGQGSGIGCTSGRGNNGQNSRSGGGVRPGFEGGQMPLYRRIARRGFSNSVHKKKVLTIDLSYINKLYSSGETLSRESLISKKIIGKKSKYHIIKILGAGTIEKKLHVTNISLSKTAEEKIIQSGGSISQPNNEESNGS